MRWVGLLYTLSIKERQVVRLSYNMGDRLICTPLTWEKAYWSRLYTPPPHHNYQGEAIQYSQQGNPLENREATCGSIFG